MYVREARTILVKMRDYRNENLKECNLGKPVKMPPFSFEEVEGAIDVAIEALDRWIETSHVSARVKQLMNRGLVKSRY